MANTKKTTMQSSKTSTGTKRNNTTSCTDFTRKANSKNCGCTSTELAQDVTKLSDKEIISDVLGSHKALIKLYGTALCETSCPKLRSLIDNQLSECAEDQYDAFLYMHERGLYPTDSAPMPKITQAKKKFCACEQYMKK